MNDTTTGLGPLMVPPRDEVRGPQLGYYSQGGWSPSNGLGRQS